MGADSYTTEGLFDEYEDRIRELETALGGMKDGAERVLQLEGINPTLANFAHGIVGIATEALKEGKDDN